MQKLLFNDIDRFRAQALFLGKNIKLQTLENQVCLATMPVIVTVGEHGCAVLLGYGAIVLFNVEPVEKSRLLDQNYPLKLVTLFTEPREKRRGGKFISNFCRE